MPAPVHPAPVPPSPSPVAAPASAEAEAAIERLRGWMWKNRDTSGAWGYHPGDPPALEPTLLAVAAGAPVPAAWLGTLTPGSAAGAVSSGASGWAALLLPAVIWPHDPALCRISLDWLLQFTSKPVPDANVWFDATTPAWGWVSDTAAWVEPTSYAVLSLRRSGEGAERRAQGVKMLLGRQGDDGGWNYGNPRVLENELASDPAPTAWALLALGGEPVAPEVIERGFGFLKILEQRPSSLSLALATLAARRHARDPSPYLGPLLSRLGGDNCRGRLDWTALALAALGCPPWDTPNLPRSEHVFG